MSGIVAWFKKWWKWLLSGLGALFVILTAGIIVHQKRRLGQVRDKLAVAEAAKEIERLRALRQEVAAQVGEKDEAIEEVDRQLAENRRRLVEAHEGGEGLTDEEIAAEFASLGF